MVGEKVTSSRRSWKGWTGPRCFQSDRILRLSRRNHKQASPHRVSHGEMEGECKVQSPVHTTALTFTATRLFYRDAVLW